MSDTQETIIDYAEGVNTILNNNKNIRKQLEKLKKNSGLKRVLIRPDMDMYSVGSSIKITDYDNLCSVSFRNSDKDIKGEYNYLRQHTNRFDDNNVCCDKKTKKFIDFFPKLRILIDKIVSKFRGRQIDITRGCSSDTVYVYDRETCQKININRS